VKIIGGEADFGAGTGVRARFFTDTEVRLKPVLPKFTVFDNWTLNGTKVLYEEDIIVSGFQAIDGVLSLEILSHNEYPRLVISRVYSDRAGNGIELTNLLDETVSTKGLYLSDTKDNLALWELPAFSVKPGETLTFAGKGTTDAGDLFKVQLPFRIAKGEVLFLTDGGGNVLDYMAVP
jgi:hypothetical protein